MRINEGAPTSSSRRSSSLRWLFSSQCKRSDGRGHVSAGLPGENQFGDDYISSVQEDCVLRTW